jgi:acyl-CoA synthetase (AMP-forming)/AMP-acid ligase II
MSMDPIVSAFDRLAAGDGAAPLVVGPPSAASRSDVLDASRAVEAALHASGVPAGAYVLLACCNGAGFLAALVGIRRTGRIPVFADWTSPPAERDRVAVALGITHGIACEEAIPTGASAFVVSALAGVAGDPPPDAAYVKLSSGSSGAATGVALTADALAADDEQLASTMGLQASDRFLAAIPWSHSYGLSSLVLPALRRGSVLIVPKDGGPWAPLDAARSLGATVFPSVPIYLQTIASLAEAPEWPESLRTVISAGAPLRAETAARFRDAFGRSAHVFYGASECGGICYDRDGGAALRGTVGTPVDGVSIALPSAGAGGEGTVQVRSAAVGLRYLPEAGDRLGGGVFRSADLASWTSAGELALHGRADAVINAGGKKVHPAEVEAVLLAMPGIRDAVVYGVALAGSERETIRAVVACDPATTNYASIVSWCRARLAPHKVPRSIVLVDAIPRNARGKVDRAALAELEPARAHE